MLYDYSLSDTSYLHSTPQPQVIVESSTPHSGPFGGVRGMVSDYFDLDTFTNKLKSITRQSSTSKCAKSIRVALQSAGAKIQSHPVAASDWEILCFLWVIVKLNPLLTILKKVIFI